MTAKLAHIWRVTVTTESNEEREFSVLTGNSNVTGMKDFMNNVREATKHYLGTDEFLLKSVTHAGSAVGTQGAMVNQPQAPVQITEEGDIILNDPKRWSVLAGLEQVAEPAPPPPGAAKKLENLLAKHPELKPWALRILSEEASALDDAVKTAGKSE